MGFGKLLEQKMNEKNIKQSELAEAVDIPKTTLSSMILRDNTKVEIEKFLKICDYLDCDPEEFYEEFRKTKTYSMPPSFTKKYYSLDEHGKRAIDNLLDNEYDRCTADKEEKKYIRFVAARSKDGQSPMRIEEVTKEAYEELINAPETDMDF